MCHKQSALVSNRPRRILAVVFCLRWRSVVSAPTRSSLSDRSATLYCFRDYRSRLWWTRALADAVIGCLPVSCRSWICSWRRDEKLKTSSVDRHPSSSCRRLDSPPSEAHLASSTVPLNVANFVAVVGHSGEADTVLGRPVVHRARLSVAGCRGVLSL